MTAKTAKEIDNVSRQYCEKQAQTLMLQKKWNDAISYWEKALEYLKKDGKIANKHIKEHIQECKENLYLKK